MRKKEKVTKVEIRNFNPTANLIFNIIIALFALSCVLPFFFVVMISLTEEHSLAESGSILRTIKLVINNNIAPTTD